MLRSISSAAMMRGRVEIRLDDVVNIAAFRRFVRIGKLAAVFFNFLRAYSHRIVRIFNILAENDICRAVWLDDLQFQR